MRGGGEGAVCLCMHVCVCVCVCACACACASRRPERHERAASAVAPASAVGSARPPPKSGGTSEVISLPCVVVFVLKSTLLDSSTRESSGPDLPGRGGDTIQCRRPRPGKLQQGSRRSRRRQNQSEVKRRRGRGQRSDIRNGYSGRHTTLGWRIKERIKEKWSPGRAGGGTRRRDAE